MPGLGIKFTTKLSTHTSILTHLQRQTICLEGLVDLIPISRTPPSFCPFTCSVRTVTLPTSKRTFHMPTGYFPTKSIPTLVHLQTSGTTEQESSLQLVRRSTEKLQRLDREFVRRVDKVDPALPYRRGGVTLDKDMETSRSEGSHMSVSG